MVFTTLAVAFIVIVTGFGQYLHGITPGHRINLALTVRLAIFARFRP